MTGLVADFLPALRDPALPVPLGLTDGAGRPAGRRFAVYRNNVAVALTEALETGFPCLFRLLGAENFRPLARMFVDGHLPSSPLMLRYGAEFPDFLAAIPALARFPYLRDIGRLELALRDSYHAADSAAMDPGRLAAPDLDRMCLICAPSLRLVESDWPIHSIWTRTMRDPAAALPAAAEHVLITRPDYDPIPHALTRRDSAFVAAVLAGQPLGDALLAAQAVLPDDQPPFDPTHALTLLVSAGALIDIRFPDDTPA